MIHLDQRIQLLLKLKTVINQERVSIQEAVRRDLHRSVFETDVVEIDVVTREIDFCLKNIKKWIKPRRVKTNRMNWPARSYRIAQPLGRVLIIGAWNYPFQLALLPAVGAIAAGNSVVIKPSELAKSTAQVIEKLITENFEPSNLAVKNGGPEVSESLLSQKWDKIFFTGSTRVGKIVYQKAAENLTPVTLELGGKNPAIFDETCNMKVSVQRMVWAKFLNAGQTCIAPDFVYVHETRKQEFLDCVRSELSRSQYSLQNDNYAQIINDQHMNRLIGLIKSEQIVIGGHFDRSSRVIEPTVLDSVRWTDPVMQEEIFGPILPVLTFSSLQDVIQTLNSKPAPLSHYFFSEKNERLQIMTQFSFGGGAINEAIMQFANSYLPFGGVGSSGMGQYHGEESFNCFSHIRSVLIKTTLFELPIKYSPLTHFKKWLIRLMINLD